MAGVVDKERGNERHGAPAWGGGRRGVVLRCGAMDGVVWCSGVGRWTAWGGAPAQGGAPAA